MNSSFQTENFYQTYQEQHMKRDKEKPVNLTPRQTELVELVVGFLRSCDEKYEGQKDVEGFEGGGVLLGPREACYRPSKDWNKLP